jgi:hypothetical protein
MLLLALSMFVFLSTGYTQKLAQIEQLPVYSETEEVVRILKEILDDIKTRLSVIDDVLAQAQKMVDDAYAKMVDWEKKLVVLAAGGPFQQYSDGFLLLYFPQANNSSFENVQRRTGPRRRCFRISLTARRRLVLTRLLSRTRTHRREPTRSPSHLGSARSM